jgi:hypothetical protein
MQKTRMNAGFSPAHARVPPVRVQKPFIAMLKLPFKFDRHICLNTPDITGGWDKSDTDRSRARLGRQT